MLDRLASRIPSPDSPLALLTLVGATAEWRAGMAPSCVTSVRLLDAVDFTVHIGECVVVHHDDPAGVRVLLAALAGHPRLLSGGVWHGARVASPGVRIRRTSVRADLVAPLVAGWGSTNARAPIDTTVTGRVPVGYAVHLLRASRSPMGRGIDRLTEHRRREGGVDHDAWRGWAAEQRRQGGAIVIVADTRGTAGIRTAGGRPRISGPVAGVHETRSVYATSDAASVRECILRNGRLLTPESQDAPGVDQYCWPSDSPLVVDG